MQSLKLQVPKSISILLLTCLIFAGRAAAFNISSVTNAASRTGSGLPGYGIAQGAVFSVIGTGVGQDPPAQATFPPQVAATPAAGNLGSITVSTILYQSITIPGVDLSTFVTTTGIGRNVGFQ